MKAEEILDKAIDKLTALRVELMKMDKNWLEEMASEVDVLLCQTHDHLSQSSLPSGVKWVATINGLPKENQKVLCWNGHRMIENSWMQYTGSDEAWFKKTFTHWATVVEPPSAIKQSQQGGQDSGQVGGQDENN